MSDLLDDLITDILLRLPVKSLLRFRCVSKTWCALIDNNSFIKQHLNRSIKTNTIKRKLIIESSSDLYTVGLYSLTDQSLKLVQPINPYRLTPTLLGTSNGLLCISYGLNGNLIILLNPATRKHVKLTVAIPCYPVNLSYALIYGFGYDSVSDDYKVVQMHQFTDEDCNYLVSETNVFSLRSNSWRMIEDITYYSIRGQRSGALACGALHWIGWGKSDSPSPVVYAFDLVTEMYMALTLPKYHVDQVMDHQYGVSELGGCLSFICDQYMVHVFDVWVMKDYGVSESWTKLLTLSNLKIVRNIEDVIPLAYSESGDEVLLMLGSKKLIWYNIEKRRSKVVHVRGIGRFDDAVVCLESLVSLGEKAESNEGAKEESEEEDFGWFFRQMDWEIE